MANQPPTVEESLADPIKPKIGSRLAKNLHIIIPGILVTALAAVMLTDAAEQDAANGPKTLAEQASSEINSTSKLDATGQLADIEAEMARQRKEPMETPAETQVPVLPPIPGSLSETRSTLPAIPAAPGESEDARAEELAKQKRAEEIRSSSLIAITGKGARPTKNDGSTEEPGGPEASRSASNDAAAAVRKRLEAQRNKSQKMRDEMLGSLQRTSDSGFESGGVRRSVASGAYGDNATWMENLADRGPIGDVITLDPPGPEPIIHQGSVIPAVLITELNSDLPGQLTAMVTMDIYDTIRGDAMLIPKGSKLVGSYNNSLTAGQERVMAAFTRIIRPDGSSIDLRAMQAADAKGQAGLTDQVDNHFFKMFSTSFLVAGLAYLFETNNQPDTVVITDGGPSGQGLGSEAGKVLVDVSRIVLDRYKVIPPTLHIRKGHVFNVIVNRDMAITAYR